MSVELRKKSSSFSQVSNPLKTVNKYQSKESHLVTCRSVSAFVETAHQNIKNQTHRKKQVEKFSIDNGKHCSGKKYCQDLKSHQKTNSLAGYKQAIQSRKKKSTTIKKNFTDELLATIDAFQETLSTLPLQKLILSGSPFYWVEEQIKTFEKLHTKFTKIEDSLQGQTKTYYELKFESTANLIKNIKQNLDSLNMMALVKNYSSGGTSLQSRNSQSTSSLGQSSNLAFPIKMQESGPNSRCHTENEDKINQGRNFATDLQKSSGFSSRNESDKENNFRYSNLPDQKVQQCSNSNKKVNEINQRDQFVLNEYKSQSESDDIVNKIRTLRSERSYSEQDENPTKNQVQKYKMSQLMTIEMTNPDFYEENASFFKKKNMNKTVSKYPKLSGNDRIPTRQNVTHFVSNESKETFNTNQNDTYHQESVNQGDETKRRNFIGFSNGTNSNLALQNEELIFLRKQVETKSQQIYVLEVKYQKLLNVLRQEFSKKEKHYLETIYDLKEENKEKQASIKHLLMEAEETNDQLGFNQKSVKESSQVNKKLMEKLSLMEQSTQVLSNELRKSKIRQDELRETVQLERQRTKKLQKQIQQIQASFEEVKSTLKTAETEKISLVDQNTKMKQQMSLLSQERQKMREKEEIYKLKYFRLYADFDKFKQKVNDDTEYWKKICLCCKKQYTNLQNIDPEKQTQLRELISFHKKRLLHSQ